MTDKATLRRYFSDLRRGLTPAHREAAESAIYESLFSLLGPLFTWKFMLMVSIVVSTVFIYRVFCRFICPLGGLYGLFNKISVFGVKVDEEKCTGCGKCADNCQSYAINIIDSEEK